MELVRTFSPSHYAKALAAWAWTGVAGKEPLCTSLFGDVFLSAPDGVWWLDTLEGTLSRPWETTEQLRAALATDDGQDHYLLGGLALEAAQRGLTPGPDQVYGFKVPPRLGGTVSADNIEVVDFVVGLDVLGQIHEQVSQLPPGTTISGITVDGNPPD